MNSRDFAYWLQGFFEISGEVKTLDEKQIKMIQNHLNLVFKHEIDPSYSNDPKVLNELQTIHDQGIIQPEDILNNSRPNRLIKC